MRSYFGCAKRSSEPSAVRSHSRELGLVSAWSPSARRNEVPRKPLPPVMKIFTR
jgi:hypothetical protein